MKLLKNFIFIIRFQTFKLNHLIVTMKLLSVGLMFALAAHGKLNHVMSIDHEGVFSFNFFQVVFASSSSSSEAQIAAAAAFSAASANVINIGSKQAALNAEVEAAVDNYVNFFNGLNIKYSADPQENQGGCYF